MLFRACTGATAIYPLNFTPHYRGAIKICQRLKKYNEEDSVFTPLINSCMAPQFAAHIFSTGGAVVGYLLGGGAIRSSRVRVCSSTFITVTVSQRASHRALRRSAHSNPNTAKGQGEALQIHGEEGSLSAGSSTAKGRRRLTAAQ